MKQLWFALAFTSAIFCVSAARADDCDGTPPAAIMSLPPPLNQWGQLFCTPYGHVIAAHEGWIWSRPGAYSPVWIPAQMVRQNPAPLGNRSYFTKIELTRIGPDEIEIPYRAFHTVFPGDGPPPLAYRLDVTSNSGKSLRLYFLDYQFAPWGIWCRDGKCDPTSVFMILNMTRKPPERH